jgi:GSH-dependent disulfide-bond oxidoreductase
MPTLYAWPTPNAYKVSIMLEECAIPYVVRPIDITKGEQFDKTFLELNPNNKMPVLVDDDGPDHKPISIFESGAILLYLAEKTGKFLSLNPRDRYRTIQWLMWQMAGFGPMLGQAHHFRIYAPEQISYGIERYTNEARRLYAVLNTRLGEAKYVAGENYSIADMAILPWCLSHELQGVDLAVYPRVQKWMVELLARDAVIKGLDLLKDFKRNPQTTPLSAKERSVLFGLSGR